MNDLIGTFHLPQDQAQLEVIQLGMMETFIHVTASKGKCTSKNVHVFKPECNGMKFRVVCNDGPCKRSYIYGVFYGEDKPRFLFEEKSENNR